MSTMIGPLGTVQVPASQLHDVVRAAGRIIGLSVTPLSHEVSIAGPPTYGGRDAKLLASGRMLQPEELAALVQQHRAGVVVLGGSGAFRADGMTHFGVRKLISGISGVQYDKKLSMLPIPLPNARPVPVLLCREAQDDSVKMLSAYITRHAAGTLQQAFQHSQAQGHVQGSQQ